MRAVTLSGVANTWRSAALSVAAAILVIGTVGCATAPTQKAITDPTQLVGSWIGFVPCRGCSADFRANLLIRDDATWTVSVQQGGTYNGTLGIVDGSLRWGQGDRWVGSVTLVEQRGREYLSIVRADGTVWTEFQRAK
jgi:hypothetical protein